MILKMPDKHKTKATSNFKDGRWNVSHLKFLVDFMDATGHTTVTLAETMGLTRQTVYHWLAKDDMKLSLVCRLFEVCGYRIGFDFADAAPAPADGTPVVVNMSIANPLPQRRLAFLKAALHRSGISAESLAADLGLSRSTVSRWFTADDCMISALFRVSSLAGLKLHIDILPL